MASSPIFIYRNYTETDTTQNVSYREDQALPSIETLGWNRSDGYAFVGYNTMRDGSGTNYAAGEISGTSVYAQWQFSSYVIQSKTLSDIADAIRVKTGKSATMTPLEMPEEILSITSGGVAGNAISVTTSTLANGGIVKTITAADLTSDTVTAAHLEYGYTAHDANGNAITGTLLPSASPTLQTITKTYTPTASTQTETIVPGSGFDGIDEVNVTINPIPSEYIIPSGSITITQNGTTNVTQYANVTVNVPTVNITQDANGYLVIDDDGNYNTLGEWTTDGIASKTDPNGNIVISDSVTTIKERAFSGCNNITSVTIEGDPYIEHYAFSNCANLETLNIPNMTKLKNGRYGTSMYTFQNCPKLKGVVFPNFGDNVVDSYVFQNCTAMTYADFNNMQRLGGSDVFRSTGLNTLIIRKTSDIVPLPDVFVFRLSPFASDGTGGTLYVPNSLISSYQSATNWSVILGYANNQIKAIENSIYETQYADGTPISS